MHDLTMLADDLTGAADSGSYFTDRGQRLTIYTDMPSRIVSRNEGIVSINLSSRNAAPDVARSRHYNASILLKDSPDRVFMKKIGTGFRGNDAFEIEGMLKAMPDYACFIIDNAPDLGTFTLYGNQYCEGQILNKSLYAKDPVMPPTKSFIPGILAKDTDIPIALVDIDTVKGGDIASKTRAAVSSGCRIVVFDAVTKQDTLRIVSSLFEAFPKVFWTGSLGIADGLATYLYGAPKPLIMRRRDIKSVCFCASAYRAAKNQIARSRENGLLVTELDVDGYIDGDRAVIDAAAADFIDKNGTGNVILVPSIRKYSYKPGTSAIILECIERCAKSICSAVEFDRIAVIGGETAQTVFRSLGVESLTLKRKLEPGVADGTLSGGVLDRKEFALKGGSVGSADALDKMLCRWGTE